MKPYGRFDDLPNCQGNLNVVRVIMQVRYRMQAHSDLRAGTLLRGER